MSSDPLFYDRVLETSTTTGTGAYSLAGTVTGFQSFAVLGNGNSCYYCAAEVDSNGTPIGGWEVGVGTYTVSGTTLSRDSIQASSNSGAAVSWTAGTRRVFLVVPAAYMTAPRITTFAQAVHSHTNAAGGGTLADAALALTDVTTNNVTSTKHGFAPKSPGDATKFLSGAATPSWVMGMIRSDGRISYAA